MGLALPLVRFAPAGRAREWAAALGAVLGGLLIFLLRALRPEVLLQTNFANPEEFDRFLQTFRDPSAPFLPSALAQQALKGLVRGELEAQFWLLLALSGGCCSWQGWSRAMPTSKAGYGPWRARCASAAWCAPAYWIAGR